MPSTSISRFRVLREGMPRETARYPGIDEDMRTKFVGAFDGSKMVGCATLQYDPKYEANLRIRGWPSILAIGTEESVPALSGCYRIMLLN